MSGNNYRELYLSEALEHVEVMNQALLELEKNPTVREHIDQIFRSAHTIKGMAATMGYDQTRELCKNIENVFDNIRKGISKVTPNLASAIFKCVDLLQKIIANENEKVDLAPYLYMLEHPEHPPKIENSESMNIAQSPSIRVRMSELDSLVNLVGEMVISKMRMEKALNDIGTDETSQIMMEIERLVTDLQYQSMNLRLVPMDQIFNRFTRLIRDISNSLGKKINLHMDAAGIELDRTILNAITDPLLHILRNCADHGIETPSQRKDAKKPEQGNIRLKAYRVGNKIAIEIQDDGKGIDLKKLKAKAVEKNLITQQEADQMPDDEALDLLGSPGLSTANEVTDISGRGVGMDVVINQVERVGGRVKIKTKKGEGTRIILTIPLRVSIIGGLLVKVVNENYVLPLSSIKTTIKLDSKNIKSVRGDDVFELRDEVIPLVKVKEILGLDQEKKGIRQNERIDVVVINKGGKSYGLVVDSLDRKQEIVIKQLTDASNLTQLFTNATILADGKVALILDPALLI